MAQTSHAYESPENTRDVTHHIRIFRVTLIIASYQMLP